MIRSFILTILLFIGTHLFAQTSCGWFGASPSSHAQVEGISVVVNNKMYVFYGFINGTQITNTVEVFDPFVGSNGQWTVKASMPLGVTHTDAVVIDGEIWLIGGFVGNHGGPSTDTIQIYNPTSNSWRYGPSLPEAHASGAAVLLGRKIHVIGGLKSDRSSMNDHHMVYDLQNTAAGWDTLTAARPPEPRDHVGYASMRGKIYIAGGQIGHDGPDTTIDKKELYMYDPIENSWHLIDSLPEVRSHIETGTFAIDGLMVITGGNTSPCCPALLKSILTYNPETQVWDTLCDMPTFLTNPAANIIGNKFILAHGGEYGYTNPQSATYMFDIVRSTQKKLGFSPSQLTIAVPQGTQVDKKVMIYTITGSTPFDLDVSNAPSWLVGTQTSNTTTSPTSQEVTLSIDATNLSANTTYYFNLPANESPSGSPQGYQSATLNITLNVVGSSFPVVLSSFGAEVASREKVLLQWQTEEEVNHDYFVIERRHASENGFHEVARLKGKGEHGASYMQEDPVEHLADGQLFYRLRMIDQDGHSTFSKIESVYLDAFFNEISLFPNPADTRLNVRIKTEDAGNCSLKIYSLKGKLVAQSTQKWHQGAYLFHLDVSKLPAGCYMIRAQSGLGQFTSKVIIH